MRISPRFVLLLAAIVAAGPSFAQATSKPSSSTSANDSAAAAKSAAAPVKKIPAERRLDFVPDTAVKGTAVQQNTSPAANQPKSGMSKDGGDHCHSKASDA